jgi:signal transduction histidine kinase
MEQLRRALAGLRAPGLGDQPLVEALQALCAQNNAVQIQSNIAKGADQLPRPVSEVVWRFVQEGLANAHRHAQARSVSFAVACPPGEVVVDVQDDGVGMSQGGTDKPGHFGLRGLRERVEGLGGVFEIKSAPGQGTRLSARMPVVLP